MKREAAAKNSYLGERAIVVGAGLGGLSAARVLSDYFDEVMILDRDELTVDTIARPGVPQAKHPHLLLGGGLKALENLFPGFGNQLMEAGAEPIDPGFDSLYEFPGRAVCPKVKLSWSTYSMTRPLIEHILRRQVERMGNIKVRGGCRVLNIVGESNVHAATGIQCQMVDGSRETLKSDLIVDASGNGSLTLEFLKSTGRRPPVETALQQKIGSLSFFRVRRNVFMIRFTLQRSDDDSAADRVEEFPTPYACVAYQTRLHRARQRDRSYALRFLCFLL